MFDSHTRSPSSSWDEDLLSPPTIVGQTEDIILNSALTTTPTGGYSQETIDIEADIEAGVSSIHNSIIPLDNSLLSQSPDALAPSTGDSTTELDKSSELLTGQALSNGASSNLPPPPIVEEAQQLVRDRLAGFTTEADFTAKMQETFGDSFDTEAASKLIQDFVQGNLAIPPVTIVPGAHIHDGDGAFAPVDNSIYLSQEFIARNAANPQAVAKVLVEEIGHFLDSQFNPSDAPGDEGAIWQAMVIGDNLSEPELLEMKAEDDTATTIINGQESIIELSTSSIGGNQTRSGSLSSSDGYNPTRSGRYYDDYRLTGVSPGQQVTVDMTSTFDTYLQLVNERTGSVIQSNDDGGSGTNSRLNFTAQSGTDYLIRATSYSSRQTGSYTLTTSSQGGSSGSSAFTISGSQTRSGSLSSSDGYNPTRSGRYSDDYRLTGVSPGQQVTVDMTSTFDTYLQLVNERTGSVIQSNDDGGSGSNSRLNFTAQSGTDYLIRATSYSSRQTGSYTLTTNSTTISGTNYFPQLSSLSDDDWDRQTSDNTGFDDGWPDYRYDRDLTSPEVEQIYTDLTFALFGRRYPMTAGYMDPGYYNGFGKWHAGIDIGATTGTSVSAVAPGTVAWKTSDFIGITSQTGLSQWVYGHVNLNSSLDVGDSISTGDFIGRINSDNHLHFETRTTDGFGGTGGASPDRAFIERATRSPLQTYWYSRG